MTDTPPEPPSPPTPIDVAVIGLGSAGEALALSLAKRGRTVVGFEVDRVGGECPFVACIPSKAMLADAEAGVAWPQALEHRAVAVSGLDDTEHLRGLTQAGVEVHRVAAWIDGEQIVRTADRAWEASHVVLATGSAPVIPEIEGLEELDYWTSADALTAVERPASVLILGGGAVGCELATIYRGFGSAVTVIEQSPRLLGDHDTEVAAQFTQFMTDAGIEMRLGRSASGVSGHDRGVSVTCDDGSVATGEKLIVSVGQQSRVDDVGLGSVGIDPREMEVDSRGRVGGTDWLWAIGDVNGRAPWTHGANHEARVATEAIAGTETHEADVAMPRCVFTTPPAAHVGRSTEDARDAGLDVVRGVGHFSDIARHTTDSLVDGLVVVVVDRSSRLILGFSGVGPNVDDIVATATALIHGGVDIDRASRMVFAFPTKSQVLEVALRSAADQLD